MGWRVLGDVLVGAHFAFLAYLLFGGFLARRRPRTIWLHVVAAIWGVLIVVTRVPCPLTALQNNARERGGQRPLAGGFINRYVSGHLYPAAYDRPVQALVALLVLTSWIGYARGRRIGRPADQDAPASRSAAA